MIRPTRSKIVATLGPASHSPSVIDRMIRAGVDVFRLNSAHLDHESMRAEAEAVRRASERVGVPIAILVDLQGPKIRVGDLEEGAAIPLQRGQDLIVSCDPDVIGSPATEDRLARIGCSYDQLAEDVKPGERILLDDGNIELRVLEVDGREIRARVIYGGMLEPRKGMNLPGTEISAQSLSAKDLGDLELAIELEVEYVAISFVRSADDVRRVREIVDQRHSDVHLIAKIERPEALRNLAEIIEVSNALMVARGDLGVEVGAEAVPSEQKRIIRMSIEARKPVITATQMLESMITNARPTRAEASDVANAIYDGSSAVMMSAETAVGKHPLRATQIMSRIIRRTERDMFADWVFTGQRRSGAKRSPVTQATVRAAAYAALMVEAKLIAVFTESGRTARLLAAERIPTPIYGFTPFGATQRRLSLVWGVQAVTLEQTETVTKMVGEAEQKLLAAGVIKPGDTYAVVVGTSRKTGVANILKLRTVGATE